MNLQTEPSFRQTVRTVARHIARQRRRQSCPRASQAAIDRYAEYSWSVHVNEALDWLAVVQAAGNDAAAATN